MPDPDPPHLLTQGGRYCRHCGYDLRASSNRCSECGHEFDPANPRTFRRRPRSAAWRAVRRGLAALLILAAIPGLTLAWLWYGRTAEDRALASLPNARNVKRSTAYPRLAQCLPNGWKPWTERVKECSIYPGNDADLLHLSRMTQIQTLVLYDSQVTDAGLAHLAGMTQMQALHVGETRITDAGLAHLTGMTQMQFLDLNNTQTSDAGMAHLAGMTHMQTLLLGETRITDAGLAHLTGMTQMQYLDLSNTQTSDAGMAHLAGMTHMQELWLDGTRVTDAGLAHLAGMTQMRMLVLTGTQVTNAGVAQLKRSLPKAFVAK